jgi:NifU-like protein involved in Fe-S cluster formation
VTREDLYDAELLRLAREATGAGRLADPHGSATVDNPLCGDRVTMEVRLEGGRIAALAQHVRGCLLCEASASLLGSAAVGASASEIETARAAAQALLSGGAPAPDGAFARLELFRPVQPVKSRHSCVLLPFEALGAALARSGG